MGEKASQRAGDALRLPCHLFAPGLCQRIEERFQGQFGGLGHFDGTRIIRAAGRFQQEEVRASGKFQRRRGIANEFSVDEDFRGIGIGGNGELAKTLGRRSDGGK